MKPVGKEPVTSLSYLREVVMDDEDIVIQTVEAFLKDAPQSLKDIQRHFKHHEWDKLAQAAHKIKPNLKYMGMARAFELIKDIEDQAKSGEITIGLAGKVKKFEGICDQALQELSIKVERLKA